MKRQFVLSALLLATTAFSVHAASEAKNTSGYFNAKNSTDRTVTIRVGNFFPSSYTLAPHSTKMVVVSSDNQNIEISDVS